MVPTRRAVEPRRGLVLNEQGVLIWVFRHYVQPQTYHVVDLLRRPAHYVHTPNKS
jgi:hypothetical protein